MASYSSVQRDILGAATIVLARGSVNRHAKTIRPDKQSPEASPQLGASPRGRLNPESVTSDQTVNELPHPQLPLALGLLNVKPDPITDVT